MTTGGRQRALLISFSGLDGAGKTTQIDNLRAVLAQAGLSTSLLAFWDNVVVLSRYREGFVHKVYGSERGIGAPGKPVERRDKNVRKWYLTIARHGLYLLDAIHLRMIAGRALRGGADVVIFDAMYALAEAISVKADWGHSSNIVGVELCQMARAKHLVLFHHEPANNDATLEGLLKEARRFEELTRSDHALKVSAAYDGLEIDL